MNPGEALPEGHLLDGRYRVRKVLGVGGMGRVYLSNDTRLANRPVAVKEMVIAEGIQEKKAVEDFAREANVLAKLSHPGVPSIIDYFVENGRHYLVMEYVSGGDLQHMLDKLGSGAKLPEHQVSRLARQLLEVLEFLHGQNPPIIYRDLKPGNIMIDKDGRAMLIDFGIARFLPPSGRGTQIGSVGYAPPEQYMGKTEPRSDLYSLGATMHHLLTGRDPQLEAPFSFPPVRDLAAEVSQKTANAVMHALNQDAAKRPASAREMLREVPEPPPNTGSIAGMVPGGRQPSSSLGSMSTVVLPKGASAPTPAAKPRSAPPARGQSAPPPSKSPSASLPTVVLTKGTPDQAVVTTAAKTIAPQIRKAMELSNRAREFIERGVARLATPAPPFKPPPRVSSTAKTSELKRNSLIPSAPPASIADSSPSRTASERRPASISRSSNQPVTPSSLFPEQSDSAKGARPAAKLVARGENLEFGIFGARTVIGRSRDQSDNLDIDLAAMKRGAERVSRKHAEIIRRDAEFFIRDLGSLNGTFIAGRGKLGRDQLYKLKDRDQVVLGGA
ncbi:MAG TPA: FHA domain-containing serine/threonine-protein kinase, partial [Candidatus Binataceae bacterium]